MQLFAYDYSTGGPKTGDSANLTAYVKKDSGSLTVLGDTSATEVSSTNAPGWYEFDLTQGETDAVDLVFTGKSSTANVVVVGFRTTTVPANFALASIDSSGRVDVGKVEGADATDTIRDAVQEGTVLRGTVTTGGTTTSVPFSSITPALTDVDQLKGRVILFKTTTATAALRGQGAPIDGSTTSAITLAAGDALTAAPASGDVFVVV